MTKALKEQFKVLEFNKTQTFLDELKGEEMPGITLRKDGRYEIRKMQNGKRTSLYAKTLAEAKKLLTKLKQNKFTKEEKKKEYTLSEWIDMWAEIYKKPFVTQATFRDLQSALNFVKRELGKVKLKELTTFKIQSFLNSKIHNRTKERIQIYFNAVLKKAYDLDMISKNPFNAVQKDKRGKYKNNAFNFYEQEKILEKIKEYDIEHEILTYLLTGARPKEFPKKENFNFEQNFVIIKGTKNETSRYREIEMSEAYSNYMKIFFQNKNFKNYDEVKQRFKKICNELNINNSLLYRLRHTFASNHFVLGTPTKQVSKWMGHSSITITLDTYTDIDKTATKEKIQKLYNNYYYTKQ